MKKIQLCCFAFMLYFSCFSQDVSPENIKTDLIKVWKISYILMGDQRIERQPNAPIIIYDFQSDNSYYNYEVKNPSQKTPGTWNYISNSKQILITSNGKNKGVITSISKNEMKILIDSKDANPGDPPRMTIILIPYK